MSKNITPAVLLLAALFAVGAVATVHAGHATGHGAQGHMSGFMAHHGFAQYPQDRDTPAKLGVAIAEVDQAQLDTLSLEYGVRVEKVLEGSIAEAAGLRAGDVITAIDDRPTYSVKRLQYLVGEARGASSVTVSRDGQSLGLDAAFAEPLAGNAILGVRIQGMTDDLKEAFGSEGNAGVLISQVVAGSTAQQAGLKAGDVIVSLGERDITSVHDVQVLLGGYLPGDKIDIAYVRDRENRSMQIELGVGKAQSQPPSAKHPHAMLGHGKPGHGNYGHGYHGHHGMMRKHGCGVHKGWRSS